MRKLTVLLFILALFGTTANVAAQYSANPLSSIYHWFDIWEGRGYIRDMPVFRPYPENVIIPALKRVQAVGDAESRAKASRFLEQLDESFETQFHVMQESLINNGVVSLKGGVGITLHGRISDTITASGSVMGVVLDDEEQNLYPEGQRTDWDILEDWSTVPFFGRDLAALNQANSSFAWGTESLYLHAGIMRRSFGPIHGDGVVLSSSARQAPGVVSSWRRGNFRWSAGLFSMTATQPFAEPTPFNEPNTLLALDDDGDRVGLLYRPEEYPGKYVFIQDFRYSPFSWLTLAFFESATWGPRFEIAYLLPVKWAFHAQGSVSYADSSKMGLSAEFRPRPDLHIPLVLYVDDASFNNLVRFTFDTKLKLAIHTGIFWRPEHRLIRNVSIDYLALLPYMYSHDGEGGFFATEPIYTNYTHKGQSLGPGMEPNSDRTTLSGTFRLLPALDATFTGRLMRHGNASADVDGIGAFNHDGTIMDDGRFYRFRVEDDEVFVRRGGLSFQDELRFLNQEHIQKTWQVGLDLAYRLPVHESRRIGFSIEAGYLFEYRQGPLLFQPTGDQAIFRDGDAPVLTYRSLPGDDERNHYGNLRFRVMY